MNESVISLARMARRLGVRQQWLRSQAKSGDIPHLQAGRRFLFSPVAVETAQAERAAKGGVSA